MNIQLNGPQEMQPIQRMASHSIAVGSKPNQVSAEDVTKVALLALKKKLNDITKGELIDLKEKISFHREVILGKKLGIARDNMSLKNLAKAFFYTESKKQAEKIEYQKLTVDEQSFLELEKRINLRLKEKIEHESENHS